MPDSNIKLPYSKEQMPKTWANVREFAEWYVTAGLPILFPADKEVFVSDDATAVCLFREGRFQVELYLIHPKPKVPMHSHPEVETIEMRLDSINALCNLSAVLPPGERHGPGIRLEADKRGFPLIAFQHWLTREPTTIATMWSGQTVGPKHEALIKRFNPNALVVDGYADITKPHDYIQRLANGQSS